MSLGYAEKLSHKEDVGMSEFFDSPNVLQQKIKQLAKMIKKSKHLVAFTGAGISTSCGIPDFRGPKGVWTLQREGKGLPEASLPFHRATPGITHMALVELERDGITHNNCTTLFNYNMFIQTHHDLQRHPSTDAHNQILDRVWT